MAYQPLTQEQFKSAQKAGFSTEKIVEMEKIRKSQSEAVPAEPPKEKKGGFFKELAKDIARPVVTLAARPIQLAKALAGASEEEQAVTVPGIGKIETVKSAKDVVKDIGRGIETAALAVPASKVAGVTKKVATVFGRKVAPAVTKVATGAATGYAFDVGAGLESGKGAGAFKPGLGTALGAAIPGAGIVKDAVTKSMESGAPRIINSLIKPLKKDLSYGKNPGRAVAEEGIVANNMEDLLDKISKSRESVGEKIQKRLSTSIKKVDLSDLTNPLDEAIKSANQAPRTNASLISRLESLKSDLLGETIQEGGKSVLTRKLKNLTPLQAWEIKKLIGDLTKFTGNYSDDAIANKAMKKIYGITKEKINRAVPQVSALNDRYANLLSAQVATKYRNEIAQRLNIVGLSPQMAGLGGALITAIATGGATIPSLLVGLGAGGVDKLLSSTAFKTRLAAALSGKTPAQRNAIIEIIAKNAPKLKEPLQKIILQQSARRSNFGRPKQDL